MYEIFLGINIFLLAFSFPHQAVTFVIRFPILHINQIEYHSVSAYTHAALHWPIWLSLKAILCAKTRSWKVLQDSGLILPADEASPLSNMPSVTATLLYPWWAYGQDVGLRLDKAGEERQEENLQGAGVVLYDFQHTQVLKRLGLLWNNCGSSSKPVSSLPLPLPPPKDFKTWDWVWHRAPVSLFKLSKWR